MNDFDNIFRQKLQGYTETPPPEVFENISKKLPKQSASNFLSTYKYYIVSAVAVVGIVAAVAIALLPSDEPIPADNNIVQNSTPDAPVNLTEAATIINSDNQAQLSSNESPNVKKSEFIAQSENKVDILDLKDTVICGNELLLENLDISNVKTSNGLTISRTASGVKLYANTYGEHTVNTKNSIVKVTFVKPETIVASASKTNLCYGEKLTITTSETSAKLNWNDGYSVAKLGACKYEITGLHSGANNIVLTTGSERCQSMVAFEVNMAEKPLYTLNTKPDFCSAGNGELTVNAKSAVNYFKINGGKESSTGKFEGLKTGKYIVEINYANSCVLFDTAFVKENSSVNASFKTTRSAFSDSKYDFSNNTKLNGQDADYLWTVNGAAVSSDYNFSYEFQRNGKYTVELVVSAGVCESRYSETIVVNANKFRIPNVFTPNGDGLGDEFIIMYDGVLSNYDLSIYTKSGQLVFHTQQIDKYWDGKISGNNEASEGVYFYVVTATDENGDNISKKGTVQLLR